MKEIFVAGIIISFSESLKKGHIGTDVPTEPPSHPPPPQIRNHDCTPFYGHHDPFNQVDSLRGGHVPH